MSLAMEEALGPVELPNLEGSPEWNIPERIAFNARVRPTSPAIVIDGETVTWAELSTRVDAIAAGFCGRGLAPGARVAVLAENSSEYVATILGCVRANLVIVPLPLMLSVETLAALLKDSGAKCLVASQAFAETASAIAESFGKKLLRISIDFKTKDWVTLATIERGGGLVPSVRSIDPDSSFNIIYSSGTTGIPKGIVHSHRHRAAQSAAFSRLGFTRASRGLISTPLYSNFSFGGVLVTLWSGGCVVLMKRFREDEFLAVCRKESPSHAFVVAVQIERLLRNPDFDRSMSSRKMLKYTSGAPLLEETKREVVRRWPGPLIEAYGMTEGGAVSLLMADRHPDKLGSVGRPAGDTLILGDDDRPLPAGEVGEIVGVAGPAMMGYHNRELLSADLVWRSPDGRTYLRSGDLGYLDDDGFLYLSGRKKDLIISGGFNVYPVDIETVLAQHPDVLEAAVIGIPSDRFGEAPLALVVRRAGGTISADGLQEWANARLGKVQRVARVEFRDQFPRGPIGKILKKELRQPYWQQSSAS